MRICSSWANTKAISDTIHWGEALLVCQLIVIYIWERAVALIVQGLQLLVLLGLRYLILWIFWDRVLLIASMFHGGSFH